LNAKDEGIIKRLLREIGVSRDLKGKDVVDGNLSSLKGIPLEEHKLRRRRWR